MNRSPAASIATPLGDARLATFCEVAGSKAICGPCPTPYNMVDAAKLPSGLVIWRTPVRSPGYLGENFTLTVQVEPAVSDPGQVLPATVKSRLAWLEPWFRVLMWPKLPLAVTA